MEKIITKNEVFMLPKNSTKRVAISAEVLIFLEAFLGAAWVHKFLMIS